MSSGDQNNAEDNEIQRMLTTLLSRMDRLTSLVDPQGQTIRQLQGERNTGLGRNSHVQPPELGVSESPGEPSRLAASGESQPPASAPSSQDGIRARGTQGSTETDSQTVITPLDPVKVAFKLENAKHFRY